MTFRIVVKNHIRKKKLIVLSLLAGVLVIFLGWFFAAGSWPLQPLDDAATGAPGVPALQDSASAGQPQEVQLEGSEALRESLADVPPRSADAVEDSSKRIDAADIPASVIAEVRRNSLNRDGTISDTLKELFSLSPEEVSFINEHIQNAAAAINEKELAKVEVIRATDWEVELRVPGLSDSEELEAEFRQGIIAFLGETDGQLFLDLIESSHLGYLDGFGRFDRTMRFSVEPRDDGGFMVEFRQTSPPEQVERFYAERGRGISGQVDMGRSFGALFPLRMELPNVPRLGRSVYMLDLLPEDIRYFFERIEGGDPE